MQSSTDTDNPNTKTTTAFSLLAMLLAAAAFKEELRIIYIPFPRTDLLTIFTIVTVIIAVLLTMYLLVELKNGTILDKRLNTSKVKIILDNAFFFLVVTLLFFTLAQLIIQFLNLTIGYQQASVLLSSVAVGALIALRGIIDKRQYQKYLGTLSEEERLLKLKISSAKNYLSSISNERLRSDINDDIDAYKKELARLARDKQRTKARS